MKKGESYITISEENNPNDKMILALKDKGINNAVVIYASMYATDAGWTMVNSDKGSYWLGYTRKEAMKAIELMPQNRNYFQTLK